jgi:MFS family permease
MRVINHVETSSPSRPGLFTWLREATPAARKTLLAATLGWMLDAFDVMLYALVIGTLLRELSISTATAGLLGSITLIASGIGGVTFGALADRFGRRRAMIGSILVYSVFTAACGLAQTLWQFGIFRFLLGLGMGGEWTSGAALVSETWPHKDRGKALALMHSGWAFGYGAAAIVVTLVLPRFGWRAVFFVGILPALLTLWMRRSVEESQVWVASRSTNKTQTRIREIFRGNLALRTAMLTLLSLTVLFAYWGFNLWMPAYLSLPAARGGLGLALSITTVLVVSAQVSTFFGYVTFGYMADAIGRRKTFVIYLLSAAVLLLLFSISHNLIALAILGTFSAFFGTGVLAGFGTVSAEMYPTRVRAIAQGFTFNVGRVGSAIAPFMVGSLAQTRGFGTAFTILAVVLLLGACTWIWLPETRGRTLMT